MQDEVNPAHAETLVDILTPDQLTLLLALLERVCADGYGEVAIMIKDGKIRFFRITFSIPAPFKVEHE